MILTEFSHRVKTDMFYYNNNNNNNNKYGDTNVYLLVICHMFKYLLLYIFRYISCKYT